MAIKQVYHCNFLTGGTNSTYLDYADGNSLSDKDRAFVLVSGTFYVYELDADSGVAESSPNIISPDTNAGTKRWILIPAIVISFTSTVTLAGQDGVTVTHNRGNTNYLVKTLPTGVGALGRIGDISYVKAANTVVIYNSGHGGFPADIELSNVA